MKNKVIFVKPGIFKRMYMFVYECVLNTISLTMWYDKPKFIQQIWFDHIIKRNEFHRTLDLHVRSHCFFASSDSRFRNNEEMLDDFHIIVKNRELAHRLDMEQRENENS